MQPLRFGLGERRSLPRMRSHVCSQVAGRRERLAACLTDMRPLPRTRPHVHSQAFGLREIPATCPANMWLVPRMRLHVRRQMTGLGERLATRLTDMRSLPRMRPHVPRQAAGLRKRLTARFADMRLLPKSPQPDFGVLHHSLHNLHQENKLSCKRCIFVRPHNGLRMDSWCLSHHVSVMDKPRNEPDSTDRLP